MTKLEIRICKSKQCSIRMKFLRLLVLIIMGIFGTVVPVEVFRGMVLVLLVMIYWEI